MLLFHSSVPECSAWNIHLYGTKKCGKRSFLWIATTAQAITGFKRPEGPLELPVSGLSCSYAEMLT